MTRAATRIIWRWRSVLLAGSVALLPACASLPAQEMSDARQAVDAAMQAGGDQKAAMQMKQARAALAEAEAALNRLQYKTARQLAQQARSEAIEAQQLAAKP